MSKDFSKLKHANPAKFIKERDISAFCFSVVVPPKVSGCLSNQIISPDVFACTAPGHACLCLHCSTVISP